jgi:hypothetical protein
MIIKILDTDGSIRDTISLTDIDRVESRSLTFFGEMLHSLYVYLKNDAGEHFCLFTYTCPDNMVKAKEQLATLLKKKHQNVGVDENMLVLIPSARPE